MWQNKYLNYTLKLLLFRYHLGHPRRCALEIKFSGEKVANESEFKSVKIPEVL